MAIPNKSELQKMTFLRNGRPFCNVTASATINPNSFEYSFDGRIWFGYSGGSSPILGHIKAVNQVDWAKVKKFNGVSQANVKTIINVEG